MNMSFEQKNRKYKPNRALHIWRKNDTDCWPVPLCLAPLRFLTHALLSDTLLQCSLLDCLSRENTHMITSNKRAGGSVYYVWQVLASRFLASSFGKLRADERHITSLWSTSDWVELWDLIAQQRPGYCALWVPLVEAPCLSLAPLQTSFPQCLTVPSAKAHVKTHLSLPQPDIYCFVLLFLFFFFAQLSFKQ